MKFLRYFSIVLSFLLLGAHFRWHQLDFVSFPVILLPLLLFVKKSWAARTIQVVLFLGGLEWVRTTIEIASERIADGEPWVKMAVILGAVAVFTAVSALPFSKNSDMRKRYGLEKS